MPPAGACHTFCRCITRLSWPTHTLAAWKCLRCCLKSLGWALRRRYSGGQDRQYTVKDVVVPLLSEVKPF